MVNGFEFNFFKFRAAESVKRKMKSSWPYLEKKKMRAGGNYSLYNYFIIDHYFEIECNRHKTGHAWLSFYIVFFCNIFALLRGCMSFFEKWVLFCACLFAIVNVFARIQKLQAMDFLLLISLLLQHTAHITSNRIKLRPHTHRVTVVSSSMKKF